MDNYYALIVAGGGGTRLWPMSRRQRPKQMLPLVGPDSMFRVSVTRLQELFPYERIFIVTGPDIVEDMRKDVPEIPPENFLVEPFGRNNGPAGGLGVCHIANLDPDATIAYLTADHYIRDIEGFLNALRAAYEVAARDYVVTLGIKPDHPATGFGYIQQGAHLTSLNGFEVYRSDGFSEKPDEDTARNFLESGYYAWNSGMFIWTASQAMAEFERHAPEIFTCLEKIQDAFGTPDYHLTIDQVWESMPSISIDYAVMEKVARMATIPVEIGWSDIGNWAAVFKELVLQEEANVKLGSGHHVNLDTQRSLVSSERTVVTIGLDDLVIIDTEDVLLVCRKDRAQDVRQAVEYLKENGLDSLL